MITTRAKTWRLRGMPLAAVLLGILLLVPSCANQPASTRGAGVGAALGSGIALATGAGVAVG
jgi:hypothetical protein